MIGTGFESRVKIQQIINNQLPEFVLDENPKSVDFLKQYYISQEYQSGPTDIAENLDQYLKLDNLTPEVVVDSTYITAGITSTATTIPVSSTKGFPKQYGLFRIGNEVITYTGATKTSFTGCQRGFSGITSYHSDLNQEELIFSDSSKESHITDNPVQNLSSLFLKEFYKKLKYTFAPGLEDVDFVKSLNAGNFIKEAKSFYKAKGTDESFRILFNVLYGVTPTVVNLEEFLIKPSDAQYVRREVAIAEVISGDPSKLVGQTITKSTDSGTNASISEVEPFTRDNKQYHKLSFFIGWDESSTIQGTFTITPSTKNIEQVSVGASVITVDSTVGFAQTGMVISGINSITYSDKSINQFIGCTGVVNTISSASNIRSNEIYYGFEDGDSNKRVELRLTGVLSDFVQITDDFKVAEGDVIKVESVGDLIENPERGTGTFKETFANSWLYNTSSTYEIESFGQELTLTLKSATDRSSLKEGDSIEIVQRGGSDDGKVVYPTGNNVSYVIDFSTSKKSVSLANFTFVPIGGVTYALRRKINKASSSIVPIEYGNNVIFGDIQNIYTNIDSDYAYVASNSLPSSVAGISTVYTYEITKNINTATINSLSSLTNIDTYGNYTSITFSTNVPFVTGDRIYYQPSVDALVGLTEDSYYVEVLTDNKTIRLYNSRSFVGGASFLTFSVPSSGINSHKFTLWEHRSAEIGAQKIFKKLPLPVNNKNGNAELTVPGSTGMLINGVEIDNYKSFNKIYYGPLETIDVLNGGTNYDVINLPSVTVSTGLGTTALCRPVIQGSITKVDVDSLSFDLKEVESIAVSGGNGSGAVLEPVIKKRVREVQFDGQLTVFNGGVDNNTNQITFLSDHNFVNGQEIIYNANGNEGIGVGIGTSTLVDKASYFAAVDNNTTIRLFQSHADYSSNSNVVGLSTLNTTGIHKFKTDDSKKTISSVSVIDGGSGYTNRKLIVKPAGISTSKNTINFSNHGFDEGDKILYSTDGTGITGLTESTGVTTTAIHYQVIKIDDDSFKLADIGIGGTVPTNYERKNHVKLTSQGIGYQNFAYPDIQVAVTYTSVGVGTATQTQTVTATPVVRGSIIDTYVYEVGTGYGSSILNFEKKPIITIKNGRQSQLKPVVVDGEINSVNIQFGGFEYYSIPDLNIIDSSGLGSGAELRPIITNGKITDVKVVNAGIGYSSASTSIQVKSSGNGASFDPQVRVLHANNAYKFGDEIFKETTNKLQYTVCGYFAGLRSVFKEDSNFASKIIGWAYDGNPIYGPYGHQDISNTSSSPIRLKSSYILNSANIENRPPGFADGFFVEDYEYNNSGDLDEHNGRFTKTQDFPNGVYAYFATIAPNGSPQFPYFIGNKYRANTLEENITLDQTFDFNNSDLLRNTFPYKVNDIFAGNDFLIETNEVSRQRAVIESVSDGPINEIEIINSGSNYKVNDTLNFDSDDTEGDGISAKVSSIFGEDVYNIQTSVETYNDAIFTWNDENEVKVTILPQHNLRNEENVVISGFSSALSQLNNSYQIGITSYYSNLSTPITAGAATTEIYVTQIPSSVSAGSSIVIGNETLRVLNIFENLNVLRVERGVGLSGTGHTATSKVSYIPDSFTVPQNINYFESSVNDKVYFNPRESVGVGTTVGISSSMTFIFGDASITRDIPTKRIYIENHPFVTNQPVNLVVPPGGALSISDTPTQTPYDLPISGLTTTVYITNKTIHTVGIRTGVGAGFTDVFFRNNGADDDNYYFESIFAQKKAKVERINSVVSISTVGIATPAVGGSFHGLIEGDSVNLIVQPKLERGVGSATTVFVKRDAITENIVVDPIIIDPANIDTVTNQITISSHELTTGDKVSYAASLPAAGLSTGTYFAFRVNDDIIQLTDTYSDSTKNPPTAVSIANTGGGSQTLSRVNPRIQSVKDNSLVFDLTDSTLSGYQLKVYYDNQFKNEFVSTGATSGITVSGVGTAGVTADAALTINYNTDATNDLPVRLYYNLEKSGFISTADTEVRNHSEILYTNSSYNSDYVISGIGVTTFNIALNEVPEQLSYGSSECSTLKYTTDSLTAKGPINKVNIISGGSGYKKLPAFVGSSSTIASDANILAKSTKVGNVNQIRILNEGFEYSSDTTLQPKADISPLITIKDSNTIGIVTVTNGGRNYTEPPNIIIVNTGIGQQINSGILKATLSGNSINDVEIVQSPKGLPETTTKLFAENNTNGISIQKVVQQSDTKFICQLTTPTLGFSTSAFSVGEEVYLEGIQKVGAAGSGFNSKDYGYKFFTVEEYKNSTFIGTITQDEVTINVSGLTTNTGIAKTIQDSLGNIIKKSDYPEFTVTQRISYFTKGEKLVVNGTKQDVVITGYDRGYIKVSGSYDKNLAVGDVLVGEDSGNQATIEKIHDNYGRFTVNYGNKKDIGWDDNIGKLSLDTQVIPNNDYYQNLSYTVKSPIEWRELRTPVNSLVHTSGLKNFADTGISSTATVGIGSSSQMTVVRDILDELRVDTIYDYDNSLDIDVVGAQSKFLKLKNRKLTDYILNKSNVVLKIDDIHTEFSNLDSDPDTYLNLFELDDEIAYDDILVRITNSNNSEIQLTDLTIVNDSTDSFLLEKGSLDNVGTALTHTINEFYGSFEIKNNHLRFTPKDLYNTDYDLKYVKSTFDSATSGVGTQSVGFIDLTGTVVGVASTTATAGITSSVIGVSTDKFTSLHVNSHVIQSTTDEMNFVELYITHDGTDTYLSESYFDAQLNSYTGTPIGSFAASISSGVLNLDYTNNTDHEVQLRSRIVGFGTTAVGVGTYRYKLSNQPEGNERTAIYQSGFASTVSAASTSVYSLNKVNFNAVKSLVEVSMGSTKALHKILAISDGDYDAYVQQAPFLSAGGIGVTCPVSGMGTFGGRYSGNNFILEFYPDATMTGEINVSAFNECFYTALDGINVPPDLEFGNVTESVHVAYYNAFHGDRIDRTGFVAKSDGTPIFAKSFDPNISSIVNLATGVFTIENHWFRTGEPLTYTPKATFVGVGSTPMTDASASALPSTVYAIRVDDDNFKLASSKANADAGTNYTFGSPGEGNAHELAMQLSNTKALITLDNLAQYPLIWTPVKHTLSGNAGGSIGTGTSIFSLSGISSIQPNDILRIDDEYMKVENVGLASTAVGPISGIGASTIVHVEREFVGSSATTHTDTTIARVYKGSYNIVGDKIHFTAPPRGNPLNQTESNLNWQNNSDFAGRVFLRDDYSTNQVYDDLSDKFTGIGRTFNLTVGGANTAGIGTTGGNGILFINSVFQTPTTANNPLNNYTFDDGNGIAGVTTVRFSGITSTDGSRYINETDVNRNQLPRGGVIVSLGSSGGIGYAPLDGAKLNPVVDGWGAITDVIGIGTTGSALGIVTASYTHTTGLLEVTTVKEHGLVLGICNDVRFVGLHFTCRGTYDVSGADYNEVTGDLTLAIGSHQLKVDEYITINNNSLTFRCSQDNYSSTHTYPRAGTDPIAGVGTPITSIGSTTITINVGIGTTSTHRFASAVAGAVGYGTGHQGMTTSIFPDVARGYDRAFAITGISSANTFTANVGVSTIPHQYVGQGTVFSWYGDLTYGSGYNDIISIGVAVTDRGYEHKFIGAATGAVTGTGGPFTPTNATYVSDTGILTLTIPSHGRSSGNVQIVQNSLVFTCDRDNHQTYHNYPRSTDPAGGSTNLPITVIDADTLSVNVGAASSGSGATITAHPVGVNTHIFVSGAANGIRRLSGTPGNLTALTGTLYDPSTGVLTIKSGTHSLSAATSKNITGAVYTPLTGIMTVTSGSHGFSTGDYVKIADNSLAFKCDMDGGVTTHTYPRSSDPISNKWIKIANALTNTFEIQVGISTAGNYVHTYTGGTATNAVKKANSFIGISTGAITFTCAMDSHKTIHTYPRTKDPFHWVDGKVLGVETAASATLFTVNVGKSSNASGGALTFNIGAAGTNYSNPEIYVSAPSYENLKVEGVSRLGIGATHDKGIGLVVDVEVGAAITSGIGSNTFQVTKFDMDSNGYAFQRGDVVRPVGLVTSRNVIEAVSEYRLNVDEVYADSFAAWQFGEFDYIDSIKNYQDGSRTRFPIYYNNELLSFEQEAGTEVNLANALLVVLNGVIQDPGVAYLFDGGTSFNFTTAPKMEDNVDVFFYRGTRNEDDQLITTINQSLKRGDIVQVFKNNAIYGTKTQDKRTIFDLSYSDKFETNLYSGQGIDETNYKPLAWTKQKVDKIINGEIVYKSRDSIEPLIYPTAKIINTLGSSDTELFVEDADLFDYDSATDFSGLVVSGAADPVIASATATVSAAGTISSYTVTAGGSGYTSTPTVSIVAPPQVLAGVGTTATATATVTNGSVTAITVNNPGLGYTVAPQVLVSLPNPIAESLGSIDIIQGFSGIVTGITTVNAMGIGTLAIQFNLHRDTANYNNLSVGHPIFIFDTTVGNGVTSIANNDLSVVGVGTTFADNIYFIQEISNVGAAGSIITYIDSGSSIVGLATTSSSSDPVGRFSWGRLAGFTRGSSPVSIAVTGNTVDVGLTTFPTIQRRGTGIRDTGALPKSI